MECFSFFLPTFTILYICGSTISIQVALVSLELQLFLLWFFFQILKPTRRVDSLLHNSLSFFFFNRTQIWCLWQPTPVFLPGKSHGQRSLVGCMGSQESDLNEWLNNKLTRTPINPFISQVKMKAAHCNNLDGLVMIFFPIDMIYLGIFLT